MFIFFVYKITNKINGKIYFGKGKGDRHLSHFKKAKWKKSKKESALVAAIRKYGCDNFSTVILFEELSEEEAFCMERTLIMKYQTNFTRGGFGYNATDGGDGSAGHLSSLRGKKRPPEFGVKISLAKKGKKTTYSYWRGKKQSPEAIEKRVAKLRGKKLSMEARQRQSLAQKGRSKSEAHKKAISKSLIGKSLGWQLTNQRRREIVENRKKKNAGIQKVLDDIQIIHDKILSGVSRAKLTEEYGVSKAYLNACVRKKFGKLPRQVPRGYLKKLTKRVIENFDQINSMLAQGFSMFELAEMYGTTASRFYGAVCRARKQFESGATSIENILKLSRAPK